MNHLSNQRTCLWPWSCTHRKQYNILITILGKLRYLLAGRHIPQWGQQWVPAGSGWQWLPQHIDFSPGSPLLHPAQPLRNRGGTIQGVLEEVSWAGPIRVSKPQPWDSSVNSWERPVLLLWGCRGHLPMSAVRSAWEWSHIRKLQGCNLTISSSAWS